MSDQLAQIQEMLREGRALPPESGSDPTRLASLSIRLGQTLLTSARATETESEQHKRMLLGLLLRSENNQIFSVTLTDRVHRSASANATIACFLELLQRVDPTHTMTKWDRIQIEAGRRFGRFVPELTHRGIRGKVSSQVGPFLIPANEPEMSRQLALVRDAVGSVNLNYLGEEVLGDEDAEQRIETYIALAKRRDIDALSVKLSGIDAKLSPIAMQANIERLFSKVSRIAQATSDTQTCPILYFDMEAYRDLEMAEELVARLLDADPARAGWSTKLQLGLAVQAYLPEALGVIERLAAASERRVQRGYRPLRIRLVKGANLQSERVEASQRGLRSPIFSSKLETDAHFKRCLRRLIEHSQANRLDVGVASHNLFDLSYALLLRAQGEVEERVQIEMLLGMAGSVGRIVSRATGALLVYAPAVLTEHFTSAVSYLVRRLDENTEPEHFLRDATNMEVGDAAFERQRSAFLASLEESWITPPQTLRKQDRRRPARKGRFNRRGEFHNASDTDWSLRHNRDWLLEHLHRASDGVRVHPLISGWGRAEAAARFRQSTGFDPCRPTFTYPLELARAEDIERAIATGVSAHLAFRDTSNEERIALLRKVAEKLEEHRGALIAAMTLDAGKRAVEADIEVSEAVDFARYYAHLVEQDPPEGSSRGLIVITPPWNFPLAIPLGGTLAALVAGNTVIMKPAPETPWVAYLAIRCCHEAGVPHDVLQFVPCRDEDASPLITDQRVSGVVLTGATDTARAFLRMRPGLPLFAETGGKNSAYVSALSDREHAISQIVQSAFGHAGQKCSALSVLILEREVYEDEAFRHQLRDAARTLVVGSAWDPSSFVTPLIHAPAGPLKTILTEGEQYGTWLLEPRVDEGNPLLLSPGILWGVREGSFPQQAEFFGPILSVVCAEDFDHGMRIINSTSYGLTACLFSLLESEQERFVELVDAGNLYINRSQTGAVVARQPFGGRKMSGFGPGAKAGGPDYARQLRHAPPLQSNDDFQIVRTSYERAMKHFGRVISGTKVTGESNFLRYQTAKTAVLVGEDVSELELSTLLLALKLTHNREPLFFLGASVSALFEARLHLAQQISGLSNVRLRPVATPTELFDSVHSRSIERLRVIGTCPRELLEQAAEVPLSVLSDPLSRDGRHELMHFLMGQSISHSFHRYGNLKPARVSRLEATLARSASQFLDR